jgi:hypothetical protein
MPGPIATPHQRALDALAIVAEQYGVRLESC